MTVSQQDEMNRLNSLKDRGMLSNASSAVDEIERVANGLPGKLAELRASGYVYKSYFENNLQTFTQQWRQQRPIVVHEIEVRQRALTNEVATLHTLINRHVPVTTNLDALEAKITAAERGIESMYSSFRNAANEFEQKVNDALWTVKQIQAASFSLQTGENAYEAVPANWKKEGDENGVEGVLFLTNRRLIFEQREEIATKKVLFITTEKQKLQSLQWAVPLENILETVPGKRGFLGKDDFLTIFISGGPFEHTDLHLRGESGETWQSMISHVRTGGILQEAVNKVVNTFKWGTVQPVLARMIEGPIRLRGYGSVRYTGDLASAWLMSLISQRVAEVVGTNFYNRSRSELAVLQLELPGLLKTALLPDFQAQGCDLLEVQVEKFEETEL